MASAREAPVGTVDHISPIHDSKGTRSTMRRTLSTLLAAAGLLAAASLAAAAALPAASAASRPTA